MIIMSNIMMKQCRLINGTSQMVAWIDQRGARPGSLVELKGFEGDRKFWKVDEVYDPALSSDVLTEKQKMNRNSFYSIKE